MVDQKSYQYSVCRRFPFESSAHLVQECASKGGIISEESDEQALIRAAGHIEPQHLGVVYCVTDAGRFVGYAVPKEP